MTPAQIIQSVIDGAGAPDKLRAFAMGIADGSVSDAQAGAFAMAVKLRGLTPDARTALTLGMRDSGDVLRWDLPGPTVDKHSTGGVGDCISLTLAPALAACGVFVPMVSGRGLGHTGGTLDKLESIPGYTVEQTEAQFRAITRDIGCAIVGASGRIAPADKRLYAIRDVTATVESIDLITASILSKKLAAGLDALVLDVKVGSGAFLPSADQARGLARSLVDTAKGAGCTTSALITDMDAPICGVAGNALEVAECLRTLTGDGVNADLWELTLALGAEALALVGQADGRARIEAVLRSGAAAEVFARMVAAQGGPKDILTGWPRHLPAAPVICDVFPDHAGTIAAVNTRAVGLAVVGLGGGRRREGDAIDPRVGLTGLAIPGDAVGDGRPLARVHAADAASAEIASAALRTAYRLGDSGTRGPLVRERIA